MLWLGRARLIYKLVIPARRYMDGYLASPTSDPSVGPLDQLSELGCMSGMQIKELPDWCLYFIMAITLHTSEGFSSHYDVLAIRVAKTLCRCRADLSSTLQQA